MRRLSDVTFVGLQGNDVLMCGVCGLARLRVWHVVLG